MRFQILLFFSLCIFGALHAQRPLKPTPADIHQSIKKLNVLGSVLYIAAHPDDENQRFISYCANHKLYDVTYLSLTRGDGGQNLIGPELRELLGVLRTQELLMARSIDGGKQRFSRANDFGFSKNPEETTTIWDRDAVLSDMIWAIRETRPDVIVNRFHHDKKYINHGHHTTSAMLSVEAFDLAAKQNAFPEQLELTSPWQPKRLFFNTSWWFYGSREKFAQADKSNMFKLDLGVYLPLKGKSNNEISAEARSMHRCQGFGELTKRGESVDYFDFIKGDKPKEDIFEGINTTWSRVEGGDPIGELLTRIDRQYRSDQPAASIPDLLKAMQMMEALPDGHWKAIKLAEIKAVIRACAGLYLEAVADAPSGTPGAPVTISVEAIQRSNIALTLTGITVEPTLFDTTMAFPLADNADFTRQIKVTIPKDASFTAPYWLLQPGTTGMYNVPEQALRNMPELPRALKVRWSFQLNGVPIEYTTEVAYKMEESAKGEVWQPFDVLPPAVVSFTQNSYLFNGPSQAVSLRIVAQRDSVSGTAFLDVPANWNVSVADVNANRFFIAQKGEEATCTFMVTPPDGDSDVEMRAVIESNGRQYDSRLYSIAYDHIPPQKVLLPARVRASRLSLKVAAHNIGYYMGAGDEVPEALRLMGCQVTLLEDKDLEVATLSRYEAIVLGVRAFNTRQALALKHPALFEYAQQGGTLVLQYNNNFDYVTTNLVPLAFKLSRVRVTDENAEMRFLLPNHRVLNHPNKITSNDFKGWVQERGLYFPDQWDASFAAPLSCNDPGEPAADGSLLIAPYGKGQIVYTALSFFRELPAGVPGAYRLFANLISAGKSE